MSTTTKPEVLLGKSLAELTAWVEKQGLPTYRGKQLYQWLYQKAATSWREISVLPLQWRESQSDAILGRSFLYHRSIADDGTRKYLLQLQDGLIIETVGIPTEKRLTVCVSTQVGCAMGCDFCATGKGGFTRNLYTHEIVDQILTVQRDFGRRVSHVVFMGMGEPLLNLPQLIPAIEVINKDIGIGQRNLTVSTVGLPQKILQLAKHHLQITLAVSLHAANQQLREKLIPTAKHYPLPQLLADCREYVKTTGRRVTFEYILLAGVNDLPSHAKQLASLVRGFQSHVNLIPYNPISQAHYQRPSLERINRFLQILKQEKIAATVRYSRGLSADAACGQLRARRLSLSV
ncbi:MAG: 23S rRNA (adenine(2503)-C(2))-methyltransferase RlmN [Geminocystis sp.]|nr:23S rRNA (adenine(2503)-C(2))-methyltransferase RlmN [Geminocystis sp.]HIK37887.1 23S rRNA (adenine(2503)-C(2))-methyltransferase RlmN [Geminocystis sp. M7585_C2015_104]MCS7146988.1 23S rRNA (adenine(2503)-C(2))-methyltransferase RlmN [Geminocystis sp.]MCX8077300.1 23S rRNA (adenine(2503)-C(2))-methyltransferase RlmN [Geminocystis sp.]MDW8115812.1 23S rRNA (adenine(2503)-C(2))-methyltransferase RlmN [Geminocystis sp.]